MASCSQRTARSVSSRIHAAEAVPHKDGSSSGESAILRRWGMSWFLLPAGSVLARIQSLCAPASARGPWPAEGDL